jgi:plasmid replication initiation protein
MISFYTSFLRIISRVSLTHRVNALPLPSKRELSDARADSSRQGSERIPASIGQAEGGTEKRNDRYGFTGPKAHVAMRGRSLDGVSLRK